MRLHARNITRSTSQDERNPSSRKLPGAKSRALNDWREMLGWERHGHGLSMSINDHILWEKIRNLTCTESYMLRDEKRAVSWHFQSLKGKITSEGFRSDRKPLLVERVPRLRSSMKRGVVFGLPLPPPNRPGIFGLVVSMLTVQPRPHD